MGVNPTPADDILTWIQLVLAYNDRIHAIFPSEQPEIPCGKHHIHLMTLRHAKWLPKKKKTAEDLIQ